VAEEAARIAVRPSLTRRQTAVDVAVAILLIPASSSASLLLAGWLAPGPPNVVLVVFVQGLLALAGLAMLLAWRRQSWHEIGLKALEPRDLPRSLVVLLTVFGANMLLTLAIFAVAPQVLRDHLAGLQSIALGLTADAPLAGALGLLLLVGFYEEAVARGLLLTRSRALLGGFWLPVLFSSALFGLGHFYQGLYGTVQTALLGVVLAAYTIRWGTLWPAIIAHAAINVLSVIQLDRLPELPELG